MHCMHSHMITFEEQGHGAREQTSCGTQPCLRKILGTADPMRDTPYLPESCGTPAPKSVKGRPDAGHTLCQT